MQPFNASARCFLRGPNLQPLYPEAAKLGLPDYQMALANDLAGSQSPTSWLEAIKGLRQETQESAPPLSVIAATSAARVGERLLAADHPSPPMKWPEILAAYRAGTEAGHEAALVLFADALQRGLGGLKPDEAQAVRLYKSLLDRSGGKTYGNTMTSLIYSVHAQSQLTAMWRVGKLEFNEAERRRYLTPGNTARQAATSSTTGQ